MLLWNAKPLFHNWKIAIYASVISIFALYSSWVFLTSNPVDSEVECGWDGAQYCLMFYGQPAMEPYRRRVLPPFLASLISESPITAFLILDLLSMAVIAVCLVFIVISNSKNRAAAWSGSIVLALILATSRNTFHHFINAPVLTDHLALAGVFIFFAGVALYFREKSSSIDIASTLLMALGLLTGSFSREPLAPAFALALLVMFFQKGDRFPTVANLFLSVGTTAYLVLSSSAGSSLKVILGWVADYFASGNSVAKFIVMIALSLGIFPLVVALRLKIQKPTKFGTVLASFTLLLFAVSIFGGGNLDRILLPVGISIAVLASISIESKLSIISFVFAGASYCLSQYPFIIMQPGARNFLGFIDFWHSASFEEFLNYGVGGLLTGLPFGVLAVAFTVFERRGYLLETRLSRMDKSPRTSFDG